MGERMDGFCLGNAKDVMVCKGGGGDEKSIGQGERSCLIDVECIHAWVVGHLGR